MPRARASLLVMLATALTAALLLLWPQPAVKRIRTTAAYRGDLICSVTFRGTVGYAGMRPCVSLMSGRVERVLVSPGQSVQKGELLFILDTAAQEEAFAQLSQLLHRQQTALAGTDTALTAMAAQQSMELQEIQRQLKAQIQAAQIRAPMDGVVAAGYVEAGDYVEQGSLLGSLHDEERCVNVSAVLSEWQRISHDAPVMLEREGQLLGDAKLRKTSAPVNGEIPVQQLVFMPSDQEMLSQCSIGEAVDVTLITEILTDRILIPLSAVDMHGNVWYVDNGRAEAEKPDVSERNESMVAVGSEWEGRHVILDPEGMSEGCSVREAFLP